MHSAVSSKSGHYAKLLAFAALFALVFGVIAAAPSQAQVTYTYGVGGEGGTIFGSLCKGSDVLVGFHYRAGKAMDSIRPFCASVQDGYIVGKPYNTDSAGGSGGDGYDTMCPQNQAIIQLSVWWDGNGDVHHVRATCHVIVGNVIGTYLAATKTKGGVAIAHASTKCPIGAVASGITGYSEYMVNKLGLQCTAFSVANNTPPAPPAVENPPPAVNDPPPAVTPPPQQANTRTAADATTVYDAPAGNEIAYLDAGDPVSIVSCEDDGQGWCKISKPKKGYVWGGDLN